MCHSITEKSSTALVSEKQAVDCRAGDVRGEERIKCVSFIMKYKVESNLSRKVTSFDHLDARGNVCIIAKDDFVYFIGGQEWFPKVTLYTDVHRYNISRNQWGKVADILQPKTQLSGAACKGRIFIAGRPGSVEWAGSSTTCECEVYSETTNEWQFISSFFISPGGPNLLSVGDQLYALSRSEMIHRRRSEPNTCVKCYDPDRDEWIKITDIPICIRRTHSNTRVDVKAYSGSVFKGFLSKEQLESINSEGHFPPASQTTVSECKCVIA